MHRKHTRPGFPHSLLKSRSKRRPPDFLGVAPVGVDGRRWALVGFAAADGVPGAGEDDAGHEDDARVVHVFQRDGEGGGHAEEGNGEGDPGWEMY